MINTINLQNGTVSCFVADVLFELVCMWFIFHLCKNVNNPVGMEKMCSYSDCSSWNKGDPVLLMPGH